MNLNKGEYLFYKLIKIKINLKFIYYFDYCYYYYFRKLLHLTKHSIFLVLLAVIFLYILKIIHKINLVCNI